MAADRDMQLLSQTKLNRQKERETRVDVSDDVLDDYEYKIVPVEWFDALEGIEETTRQELNFKLARVRNQF